MACWFVALVMNVHTSVVLLQAGSSTTALNLWLRMSGCEVTIITCDEKSFQGILDTIYLDPVSCNLCHRIVELRPPQHALLH